MKQILIIAGLVLLLVLAGCASKEPATLSAKPVAGGIQLDWASVQDVAGYNVYRSTDATDFQKITPTPVVGKTTFIDRAVKDSVLYYYMVKSVDNGGTEYGERKVQETAKTAPPTLGMTINNGANFTAKTSVDLQLSANNAKDCRYSNDGVTWSDWESYTTIKSWTLTDGDGDKVVYYQCRDTLGNIANPASASIFLDTIPPTITISSPVEGKEYVGTFDLVFTATDPIATELTCDGTFGTDKISIGVVGSGEETKVTIHSTTGTKTLFLECSSEIQKASKSVTLKVTDKPTVSIVLGDGSGYTPTNNVKVTLSATNAKECKLSNDNNIWSAWDNYQNFQTWKLIYGDGYKTVYVQCRSPGDALSDTASDSITIDSSPPPYISITINNEREWTNSKEVRLGLYAFSAYKCRLQNEMRGWTGWEDYTTSMPWTLSSGEGNKTISYECKDRLDREVGLTSASIVYSEMPPDPPSDLSISINDGDSYTTSKDVTLKLSADNAVECRYSQDDYDWTSWYAYRKSKSMTLQGGDGTKTVYYQCRNDYGTRTESDSIYLLTNPPHKITDLYSESSASAITLRWSKPIGNIKSYQVLRSNTELGLFTRIASVSYSYYVDYTAEPGIKYAYSVLATDVAGQQSGDSNVVNGELLLLAD